MNAPRDVSYQDYLTASLADPVEAAAYVEAVLGSTTPPRCWWPCGKSPKRTAWQTLPAAPMWARRRYFAP